MRSQYRRIRSLCVLASALVLFGAGSAHAYTVKRTPSGAPVRWTAPRVDVHVHASMTDVLSPGPLRQAVGIATDAWRGLGAPDLVPTHAFDARPYVAGTPGIQIVRWDPWTHAPQQLAVTVTTYRELDGTIVDADVLVNPAYAFDLLDEQGRRGASFDLAAVLTHEAGHALGLGESEADAMATMWPRIARGDTHQRTLAQDDEDGIAEAYADLPSGPERGCGGARVASGASPWPLALGLWLVGLVALVRRRAAGLVAGGVLVALLVLTPSATEERERTPRRASRERAAERTSRPAEVAFAPLVDEPLVQEHVDDEERRAPFAAGHVRGPARVIATRRGEDGLHRTELDVAGARVEVLGGCLDGLCQEVGDSLPPSDGELVVVAPATGAWARLGADGLARDGWLAEPLAL